MAYFWPNHNPASVGQLSIRGPLNPKRVVVKEFKLRDHNGYT